MDCFHLTVGEKFDRDMPAESMSIVLNGGGPMLAFTYSVTEKDIAAFQEGSSSFALFSDSSLLFFLFRIEGFLEWSDLAFTIHLAGNEQVIDNGSYLPFHLILVESGSLIIKAIRMITVSPAFRSLLSGLIRQQAGERFNVIDYYQHIGDIYRMYPSAASLLKKALIIEQGGITLPGEAFK